MNQTNWIWLGLRPKTLIAGIIPPVLAFGVHIKENGFNGLSYFILCLLLAIFIQIATNFYNDAIDYKKGADKNRVGPARVTTQMEIPYKRIMITGHIFLTLGLIVGVPLVMKGGVVFALLGVLSLFLAYGYTGGPFPLAYLGLGELFVFLFFGLVATVGSYYLIAGDLNYNIFLVACQLGLLSSVLIAINNFRDRHTDKLVNKNTLATRMSDHSYLLLIDFFLFIPYFILMGQIIFNDPKGFLPLLAISIAHKIRKGLRDINSPEECNEYLALSAKHLLLFGILKFIVLVWN